MPQALKGLSFVVVGVGMTHDWAKLDLIDSGRGPAGSVLGVNTQQKGFCMLWVPRLWREKVHLKVIEGDYVWSPRCLAIMWSIPRLMWTRQCGRNSGENSGQTSSCGEPGYRLPVYPATRQHTQTTASINTRNLDVNVSANKTKLGAMGAMNLPYRHIGGV